MLNAIVNLRDVGEFINCLSGRNIMLEKRLYRGGKIECMESLTPAVNPNTIINLRATPDQIEKNNSLMQYHFPIVNSIEKYDTQLGDVRRWLNGVLILSRGDIMKMYILVKETVPLGFAIVAVAHASLAAYLKFEDTDDVKEWLAGPFYKVVCKVNEKEFIRAKEIEENVVITESSLSGEEVAIAFKPRETWPNEFKYFRLYK